MVFLIISHFPVILQIYNIHNACDNALCSSLGDEKPSELATDYSVLFDDLRPAHVTESLPSDPWLLQNNHF